MATYSYTATTLDGSLVEGIIEAPDEKGAIAQIQNTGIIPIRITAPREGSKGKFSLKSHKGDLLTFTTELSALTGAGLPLDRSLNILSNISEGKEMKQVVASVLKLIREGSAFSDALSKYPRIFPKLYVSMVRAGEIGGVLDVVLDKLNEFLETSKELKSSIISAMIYPTILAIVGVASLVFLLTFVIPQFSVIFKDLGGALPLSTQIILSFSNTLRSYWWMILSALVVIVLIVRSYIRNENGARKWDEIKLKLIGELVRKLETARFCRTLGTLIKSGVPFLQALNNSKDVIGNRVIAGSIEAVAKNVREGKGVAGPLIEANVFPLLALSMIKVGEETGQLDVMLLKVASTYEKNLKEVVKRFTSLLGPIVILSMALVIALVIASMLLAMYGILDLPF
ncbi:MAG TPA: type II secretion system F family protein [Syntrophorhabdaceae bacterium]|nr:type II secretion system F family protein [Syntrophorhabdaceae bacterium]